MDFHLQIIQVNPLNYTKYFLDFAFILIFKVHFNVFRDNFADLNVDEQSVWADIKLQVMDKEAFMAVTEDQAEKMFK